MGPRRQGYVGEGRLPRKVYERLTCVLPRRRAQRAVYILRQEGTRFEWVEGLSRWSWRRRLGVYQGSL